jgi:hypothetical protein
LLTYLSDSRAPAVEQVEPVVAGLGELPHVLEPGFERIRSA